jgi:hypothetical protein
MAAASYPYGLGQTDVVPELPLTGGCLCSGVRFEVTEPPVFASYCHDYAAVWEPIPDDGPARYPAARPPDA